MEPVVRTDEEIMGETHDGGAPSPAGSSRGRPNRRVLAVILVLAALAGIVFGVVIPRLKARAQVQAETVEMSVPTVSIVRPKRAASAQEVLLPGNIQAFTDAPIYARTNGYLKRWYADIGAQVRSGQLLAEIESPEVDQQLQQARADLSTAEANKSLAEITANRYQELLKTDSVAKQDVDNAVGDLQAKSAMTKSAQFNVKRLEQLQSFEKIYAPFDGVVTARNTDIGQLIDSGSAAPAKELFHLAATRTLRVYVNVPQAYSQAARPGLSADLTLPELPGRRFRGRLVRNAKAIDMTTRTLRVEVDLDNPTNELLPGAYAEVHLKLPADVPTFLLPVNSLIFRSQGLQIATVNDGKHATLASITLGRDFGAEVEVIDGLKEGDAVIANPPDSLVSGEEVRIARPASGGS